MLRTKNQEKKLCSSCPIAKTAHLIGDSYTLLIVRDLLGGPKNFSDLESSLSGISTRTLTKKLNSLVGNGTIVRKEFMGKPTRVTYSLTKKGQGLLSIAKAMETYGEKFL